jgi:hypothetical protein
MTGKPDLRPIRQKTLDELEGVTWGPPSYGSHLVQSCHRLRTKPIGEYGTEDLRIMIGQNIGLPYLMPLAIETLEKNPWAAGHMYPGDLLKMTAIAKFPWATRVDLRDRLRAVIERALIEIPALRQEDDEGMPNLDVPDETLAAELAVELQAALDCLVSKDSPGSAG